MTLLLCSILRLLLVLWDKAFHVECLGAARGMQQVPVAALNAHIRVLAHVIIHRVRNDARSAWRN